MERLHTSAVAVFLLFSSCLACAGSAPLTVPELISALQEGGHIIYMRHSATIQTQKDTERDNLYDCSQQRNLSEEGKTQAEHIGQKLKALNIPVGDVYSSPYCRCKDTAELAFGAYTTDADLAFSISKDKEESERLGQQLLAMMMKSDSSGPNTVFVGHTSNLRDGLGVWPKPEGVIVVFKKVDGDIVYLGMIKPDEWP